MNDPQRLLPGWLSRRDLYLWLGACALLVVAFTSRLLPGWNSIDDFQLAAGIDERELRSHFLSQGRFGMALLQHAFVRLGADPVHAPTLHSWLSIGLFAASAVFLAHAWDLQDDPLAALFCCALPLAHPYLAETWSFHIAPIYCSLAQALGFGALALLRRGRGFLLLPVLMVVFSLSIYQVGLSPLLVVGALGGLVDLLRVAPDRAATLAALRLWAVILAAVTAGVVLYLGANQLVLLASGVGPEARNGILGLSGWPERALAMAQTARSILWTDRALSAPWLVQLQAALLAGALFLLARQALRLRASLQLLLGCVAIAGAFVAVLLVAGAAKVYYPAPRVLNGLGFFWGGLLAAVLLLVGLPGRRIALAGAALLAFGWLGIDHRAGAEQQRANQRDLAVASRLAGRLEVLPGWAGVERLVILDAPHAATDLRTVSGDLNNSALRPTWSQPGLLQEVTGRRLQSGLGSDFDAARVKCAALPKWPAAGSAVIDGPLAIACF